MAFQLAALENNYGPPPPPRLVKFHRSLGKENYNVSFSEYVQSLENEIRFSHNQDPDYYSLIEVIKFGNDPATIPIQDDLSTFCIDYNGTLFHQSTIDLGYYRTHFQIVIPENMRKGVIDHFCEITKNTIWPFNDLIRDVKEECWWPGMAENIRSVANRQIESYGTLKRVSQQHNLVLPKEEEVVEEEEEGAYANSLSLGTIANLSRKVINRAKQKNLDKKNISSYEIINHRTYAETYGKGEQGTEILKFHFLARTKNVRIPVKRIPQLMELWSEIAEEQLRDRECRQIIDIIRSQRYPREKFKGKLTDFAINQDSTLFRIAKRYTRFEFDEYEVLYQLVIPKKCVQNVLETYSKIEVYALLHEVMAAAIEKDCWWPTIEDDSYQHNSAYYKR